MIRLLLRAATVAVSVNPYTDLRSFMVGAVGIRRDGAVVESRNAAAKAPSPRNHAEAKVVRKLDRGADVYVARVSRSGNLALAKPCVSCMKIMLARGVRRCYYSVGPTAWGVVEFRSL